MISEKLRLRLVFANRPEQEYDKEGKALINRIVRKLVLLMKSLEAYDIMTREQIEDCVLSAFESAEYLYYALGEHELMLGEIVNGKRHKRNSKSL